VMHLLKVAWSWKRATGFLVLEIVVTFIVLFAIAATGLSYYHRFRRPVGFVFENLYTVMVDVVPVLESPSGVDGGGVFKQLLESLESMPEVIAVAGMSISPFEPAELIRELHSKGKTVRSSATDATDDAQRTLGIKLSRGRWFDARDDIDDWVPVVINQILARELFGDADPLGQTVQTDPEWRVVGVVEAFRRGGHLERVQPASIHRLSLERSTDIPPQRFIVRVRPGTDIAFEKRALERLRLVKPDWAFQIQPTEKVRRNTFLLRIAPLAFGGLVAAFLVVMVVLGMIGVFWQSVTRRTHEIGLRRAMGATKSSIYRQFLGEVLLATTIGAAMGLVFVLQLPLLGIIDETQWQTLPESLLLALLSLYSLAVLSGLYPAWLAANVQPAQALHYE
jgi:putative ABC transport system permease protein